VRRLPGAVGGTVVDPEDLLVVKLAYSGRNGRNRCLVGVHGKGRASRFQERQPSCVVKMMKTEG
jgi:hypothetical protein